jgi:TRAP-type C4-dicarboxylate transport system substrate-binding protein
MILPIDGKNILVLDEKTWNATPTPVQEAMSKSCSEVRILTEEEWEKLGKSIRQAAGLPSR